MTKRFMRYIKDSRLRYYTQRSSRSRRPFAIPGGALLKLDPHNANRGTDRGRRAVADSLAECGAGRSILVDRDGTVIAGNKTLEAAQALGLPVRVVETSLEVSGFEIRSQIVWAKDRFALSRGHYRATAT